MSLRDYIYASRSPAVSAASAYLRAAGFNEYGPTHGTPIMRNGSLVGATCVATISGFAVAGTLTLEIRKNDVVVFTATSPTIVANSTVSWQATQAEGIDLFDATLPDVLQMRLVRDSGTFNYLPTASCKLILDEDNESFRTLLVGSNPNTNIGAGTEYMRTAGGASYTGSFGNRMLEGGSIVGIGMHGSCTTLFISPGVIRGQIRVNNTIVFETDNVTVTGLGPFTRTFKIQAPEIDTFAAGDLLQVSVQLASTFIIQNVIIDVELQFPVPVAPPTTIEIGAGDVSSIEIGAGAIATTEQGGGAVAPTELGSGVIASTEVGGGPSGATELGA